MIRFLSDNLLRLIAPINVQPDPNVVISAGTCTARLFDSDHETTLTATAFATQTELSVARARSIEVGSTAVVQLDDGSYHAGGLVTARNLDSDTVTVTTGLASSASAGARLMTQLGPDIALAAYGTPALSTLDWGFEGIIEGTHAGLQPGQSVRIEILLDASGLELLEVLRERVAVGF